MALTHALSTNNYGPAKFIVATSAANGTHVTLAGALADASSGDTVFLRDSVTENVTLPAGINIAAWSGGSLNTPSITGTIAMTAAGTSNISGLELITNSAAIIAVTGSAASILNVNNCYLNCSNNSGITFSASNTAAMIIIRDCQGNLGTTGIGYFVNTSTGTMTIDNGRFTNTGGSSTASTSSAGTLGINYCFFAAPITTTSTAAFASNCNSFDTSVQNVTALTIGGSGSNRSANDIFNVGSASAISIGSTLILIQSEVVSSNTNSITGAGTLSYTPIAFSGTSKLVNTTTQTPLNYGTFTPTVVGQSTAGTTTYITQAGFYTIVGNLVLVEAFIDISAATGTGVSVFGGLPFTIKNITNYTPVGTGTISSSAWSWGLNTMTAARGSTNSKTLLYFISGSLNANFLNMTNGAATFFYSMWYQI